jgi:hypothetical protein
MYDQAIKLEDVKVELMCAKAVVGFLGDYFEPLEFDPTKHRARYSMYSDLQCVLLHLLTDVEKTVEKIVDEYYETKDTKKKEPPCA